MPTNLAATAGATDLSGAGYYSMNPDLSTWANQNRGTNFASPEALYAWMLGPGRVVSGQGLRNQGYEAPYESYYRPKPNSGYAQQSLDYNPPDTLWDNLGLYLVGGIAGGGALFGAGGASGAATGALGAADTAGLAAMGEAAGLSGSALDAFVASGGTMGSTAAGGGGIGLGATLGGGGTGTPGFSLFDPSTWSNPFSGAGNLFSSGGTSGGPVGGFGTGAPAGGGAGIATPGFGSVTGGGTMDFMEMLKQAGLLPGSGGPMSNLLNIGSGLYGMYQSNQMMDLARQAAAMQDPFGPQRPQYQAALSSLYANPSSITGMPGYQAGLDAVERKMASQGYLGSGNMMAALSQYGGDFFDKEVARLSTLSGAQFAPTGGNALLTGTQYGNDLASRSLATLGYGVRGLGW